MDEIAQGLDPDDLMDLDEGSDLDEEEDELIDDALPSPFQFPSSGSAATSAASSPPNDDFPLPFGFSGKPFSSLRRGRGRPRRDFEPDRRSFESDKRPFEMDRRAFEPDALARLTGALTGKPAQRRQPAANRIRKPKPPGLSQRKKPKSLDFDLACITQSPGDEIPLVDPETGALIFAEREKPAPVFEELPYFPEQWPGKVCAFCNLGERSQLGQGEMMRLLCPDGFIPQRTTPDTPENLSNTIPTPERDSGDKSPRGPVTCRRQKSFNKCRHPSLTSEYVDELTIIGYTEEPHVSTLFDSTGYFYTHRSCALWSNGVVRNENSALENVGPAVLQSSSRKCSFCNHYGASILCKVEGCTKVFHFPCATASGAFQVLNSLTLFCSNHIGQASLECENAVCYTCKTLGDIANLMYCSSCGEHYHGICVGLAQLPGVRAGWQCRKCRICQVCRMTGDETKLMTCEQCDKIYHSTCQRPIVTSIPKYGWKCRCCRVCGDCGSRTPGAGLSSRWHAHYTVCDSCYQQRNKGFSCPLCHRAYRAHAHREMVQCTLCRKFVHGTCDPEADLVTYHQRKEAHPEYEYACLMCKNLTQPAALLSKRNSLDDPSECVAPPQESPYDENAEFDSPYPVDAIRNMGLGKGKPYSASKIAKKRLGLGSVGASGRPKGVGKGVPGKVGFMKRQRLTDFGRKRGAKAKMRGVFGVPGVGLQRPVSDGKNDEEPGVENRLVLCSAKDKFVLTQDICVMCGALGTDQEGCLIACVQCGQCYHPYCVNVKVTKVILQKGWRCLDCTVCEGCGQRNDEARLILCDDCDISYHIYCMDPPLDYVPHGNWKCKWCAICQSCGATDPGFNCTWMNSFTVCGPCASHVTCPSCSEPYSEGDLIIQCVQCERWLHGTCDAIKTEDDAEKCAEEGYNCLLCRPRDVPPPHLIPSATTLKPPTPTKSPEVKSNNNYYVDGVYLSEVGFNLIKSLSVEQNGTRKKRKKIATVQDKEAGIMATIESVVAGGSTDNMLEDSAKLELVDVKEEPQEIYKEGMIWMKEDGPPPEGFTLFTMENGVSVLRRKRQRNLQKLGIGGFLVRMRGVRTGQDNDDIDVLPGQLLPTSSEMQIPLVPPEGEKPRRKPVRRKPKSKLAETFPPYLQEAFFGKELLDSTKEVDSSSSDEEKGYSDMDKTIQLTQDEIKAVAAVSGKHEGGDGKHTLDKSKAPIVPKEEEEEENTEDLKDVLAIPGDLLDTELVNTIMNEGDAELNKNAESLDALTATNLADETDITNTLASASTSKDTKDELTDILGPNFNLETMPSINSKDVEDIFKGVLTDDSQESQESNVFPIQNPNSFNTTTPQTIPPHPVTAPPVRPTALPAVNQSNLNSPLNFPPPSPYQSEYSNSPQFSPAFSEPPSPWVSVNDNADMDTPPAGAQSTYNQRSSEKMKADEGLGNGATISAVLYANINQPEWKTEFPNWSDRYKQILKKWRTLSSEQKAPYLQQARDNRSALRMKKQQQSQISKEASSATSATTTKAPPPAAAPVSNNVIPSTQVPAIVAPVSEDQEKVAHQHKSAREAEQERQWKQLQATRQQQAQQQQNIIHEQRVQCTIARVQRQISDPTPFSFQQEQTPQELSPVASPSPNPRQILSMGIKSPTFTHPAQPAPMRPIPPTQAPLDFSTPDSDPYAKAPSTPKLPQPTFQNNRLPADPYAHQPSTPRPQFQIRPPLQALSAPVRAAEAPELNRQLRDLLQRQQFKKLDDQLLAGKGQQRVWPPTEASQEVETPVVSTNSVSTGDATFRQPLPPSIVRPRMPVPVSGIPRQPGSHLGLRMQLDPRIQGLDPRMRLLLQQQQQRILQQTVVNQQQQQQQQQQQTQSAQPPPQVFSGGTVRFTSIVRPTSVEQYEQLLPRQQPTFQPRAADPQGPPRLPVSQIANIQRPPLSQTPAVSAPATNQAENAVSDQEIPDNVTAELEKLEQETGTMAELQGVGDILGGLGDDDDELLAEMGADFNILEYADPEALPGEKTNILDIELEEEPIKNEKKVKVELPKAPGKPNIANQLKKEAVPPVTSVISAPQSLANNIHPPPLAISQAQTNHPLGTGITTHLTPQQIHQQMLHQVQQAAAHGKPMPPGSRLQTPDGFVGIVTPNNNVQLQLPQGYHQRLLVTQLHNNQKLQMRLGQNVPRIMSVAPVQQAIHNTPVGLNAGPRLAAPPPPPPPYPGPPPPYPGSATPQQQMGLRMGPVHLPLGHIHPMRPQGLPLHPHLQRRPLLLEEQPLLLEDLLEQEKREQEKQNQNSQTVVNQEIASSTSSNTEQESAPLLTDQDFERITDVLGAPAVGINANARQAQVATTTTSQVTWQQTQNRPKPTPTPQPPTEIRVQTFNANLLTPPPLPPENIVTEQDKQKQLVYEQWLSHQETTLNQQLKYYETEVNKLRKMRKSLNSKQRQLRKTGGQLSDADANELQRITAEQAIFQKHLESSRKLSRQHGLLVQEYRNKQQAKQRPVQSPLLLQQNHSPLGPPSSSPIHHSNTSQSPMMSPSASPLTQHSSPLHSPSPMISHSPGPGSVTNILQSPNGMSPMQPSPRIGTPHSQGDSSPGPAPSPSQVCLPPPAPRMTSPQHKRVVTSPVGYTADLRPGTPQMRFVRTPMDHGGGLQRRLSSPMAAYQQKPGTPSPLSSPPPQAMVINQQLIQKQLQEGPESILNSARAAQLIQQRNLVRQQQQQQGVAQPPPLTPQQHQMMVQQQQQLAKQQQLQIAQMQAQLQAQQQRLSQQQNAAPASPMPPKSPLIGQHIMSPHSMPPSPMPPKSPMMSFSGNQTPNSPVTRNFNQPPSPMTHSQYQPPSSPMPRSPMIQSPMGMRRPPSSPAMPDRPRSVENHSRSFSSQNSVDNSSMMDQGGGNPHNPNNPIPLPPNFGRFGYFKLGLRGGSPMWSFGRGAKRIPTPPGANKELEKAESSTSSNPIKPKKESHLSKVSILKRKSPAKTNLQSLAMSKVGSLVSSDYNEFDDSSCTPPVTPPPMALTSTSRVAAVQKTIGKKIPEENKEVLIVHSPDEKQLRCDDIMDYDDDNNTVISGEVSLSSAAQQNDVDDVGVMETFSQSDLGEAMSSPLESDQIADEYLLFPGNMVVDLSGDGETHYSDKEEAEEEDYGGENMHVVIRSPTTSDDEFIMQNKGKKYNIRRLPSNHLLEATDSPEGEEMHTDPSPDAGDEDAISNYEESEIVIIDPSIKSPDEQISTKEDFEELIDEGSRKDKMLKQEVITAKHINEIHKYAANVYSFPPKTETSASNTRVTNLITSKLGPKFSLITTPVMTISRTDAQKSTDVVAQTTKLVNTTATSKLTNIILHNAVRSNVLSVPKLVTSGSPAITIVSANTSPIASILPSGFTVPVISASAVRQLPNVKVIDKPSSSISLTTHDTCLPKKIFEDDSVSPDSSNCEDDKSKDSSDEKSKTDSPPADFVKQSPLKLVSEPTRVPVEEPVKTVSEVAAPSNETTKEEVKVQTTSESDVKKVENVHVTSIKVHNQRVPSPIIAKTTSPVIIHSTPELKMTAQVIQEPQSGIQITARAETVDGFEGATGDDTKSVVISIPSPTPSQEQILDNIALQAFENRRRDGNGMPGEFESFEDVLDMIENITAEPPAVLEDNIKDKINDAPDYQKTTKVSRVEPEPTKESVPVTKIETKITKPSVVPQLSPLSQPTDLTTNMANASQQLRTLLSLHTTTATSSNNVESVVKSKVVSTGSVVTPAPVVTSRVIQQASSSTVIVPNVKPKTVVPPIRTQSTTIQSTVAQSVQITTSGINFLPARSGGIQLMPEHPKLPRVTAVNSTATSVTLTPTNTVQKPAVTTTSETTETTTRKTTCSLTEMLQSHPAAVPSTKTSADTITAASLLGTSISLSRSGFSTSLVQAQPNVVVSPVTTTMLQTSTFGHTTSSVSTSVFKTVTSGTNLLHTQLTKVIRHKSLEETLSETIKEEKVEPMEISEDKIKTEPGQSQSGCKFSTIPTPPISRNDDSQNALLKKLLQNTACASTQTPPPTSAPSSITVASSTQFPSSLENQLKASILSPVVKESVTPPQTKAPPRAPIMSRETSFVSSPVIQQPPTPVPTQQLHIDIKKCLPPSRTPSRDDLLSPPTPRSSCSQDSSLQTPPLIKKEPQQPLLQQEVKKEIVDETSQHSEVSDQSRSDVPMKEEIDSLDPITEKMLLDKEELKKQKRRMYQQKRRQNQIMNKEAVGQPKKRPRKSSKVDEDYDTYIDGVLAQLRTLPPMVVSEPVLNRNFNICPVFGSDMSKLAANDYDSRFGELKGEYGNAYMPGYSDFYNTQPYGDHEPLPEKPPASTQRGFYDQEFPLIKFDAEEEKRFDMFCREDSPDSIISSSSPECPVTEPPHKFLGLKLINEDDDEEDDDMSKMRLSPVVPIVAPIPIRLKPTGPYLKDYTEDKENVGREVCLKSKFGSTSAAPLKDSGNVTVTLTLTSSAAEDIMGVLRDLANILHIPAPTSYQIVERTSTPPSQKLGLYRTKGKDGKEGAPIDIQSILNGAAKFCKHCDVVILNNMIRKKVSELPFLSKDSELLSDGDELFFCSTTCYMQFALMHRSPSIPEDKAAAIIDHLCHKDKHDLKGKRPLIDSLDHKKNFMDGVDLDLRHFKREVEPMDVNEIRAYSLFTKQGETIKLKRFDDSHLTPRVWKGVRYKSWTPGCLQPPHKHKKPTDKETMELLYRMGITVTPIKMPEDFRRCMFCQGIGDGVADGPARLLNFDVDKWVHLNCGLWSDGVYETVNGALMNLENAIQQSLTQICVHCNKLGATIRCFKTRCSNVYHLTCAVKDGCVFYKNKTTYCTVHVPKNEKDNELTTLSVSRRVYVNRDENRQVAAVMHHSDTNNLLRVGSLIFLSVGQLLPHQLQNFHNQNFIYPIGYKIIRFYWSMRHLNKRCKYICSIHESFGKPEFRVVIQEGVDDDVEFKDSSPKALWHRILDQIASMRRENQCVQVFPQFVSGEDLFGLTEPAVVRVLESLPGIETLTDYKFKYGRNPLLELPLAINPSGSARTEPRSRSQLHWKRPHTQRTSGSSVRPLFGPTPAMTNNNTLAEGACPYTKQFVHSKSSQYKKMKQEWRNNVYLARSKIQGLGLYAARDLEKHTMVIEYIGEIIRTELAETREKKYEAKNRGIYMFRLDEERVVDATLCGGLARYINHSCNPNCVAETVEVDRDCRIIIFAKRRIQRGEELAYDYKFDIEDDQHKISCMCGAPNCRKWMN
ncbi:histone-lysine N-methyltransferase 2C-like isoform X2 [Zophobas morio]|uniref:histone-lysine N-methyltransferase 2C-like isoform X2 n=1 Tax=Zophobas morio TaxID=2755281 RepID=UPI003083BC60